MLGYFKNLLSRFFLLLFFLFLLLFILSSWLVSKNTSGSSDLNFIIEEPDRNLFKKFVYLTGAVQNPGVYEIKENERLIDLIIRSGGLLDNADHEMIARNLNLASKLLDEEKIFIPFKNNSNQIFLTDIPESVNNNFLININMASKAELESLPGVGSVIAQRIIDYRPFESIEDLKRVPGISQNRFDQIRNLITL